MFHFKLSGANLAEKSGVSEAQISNFRRGNNLRIDTVERILDVLPKEAKLYMLNLVAQDEEAPLPSFVGDYQADHQEGSEG